MLPAHWEGGARATLTSPLRGRNAWTPARAARKGGSRGEFRAARLVRRSFNAGGAVRFRQGSARNEFALFPKLTTFHDLTEFAPRGFAPRRGLSPSRADFSAEGGEARFINCRYKPFC